MMGSSQNSLYARVRSYRRGAIWASIAEARKSTSALLSFCTMVIILIVTLIIVGLLAGASLPGEGEKGFSFKATFLRIAHASTFLGRFFFKKNMNDPTLLIESSKLNSDVNSETYETKSKSIEIYLPSSKSIIHLHYLEAGPDSKNAPVLVLLHGNAFTSKSWVNIGTLDVFSSSGIKVYAFDLPGHGKTTEEINDKEDREILLNQIYVSLKIPKSSFIVSPSMSGRYSLPFLVKFNEKFNEKFSGYIPISPAGIQLYLEQLKDIDIPTLVLWGEKDNKDKAKEFSNLFKNSILEIFPNAGHACYMENPTLFHSLVLSFIKKTANF